MSQLRAEPYCPRPPAWLPATAISSHPAQRPHRHQHPTASIITGCATQPARHEAGPGRGSRGRDVPEGSRSRRARQAGTTLLPPTCPRLRAQRVLVNLGFAGSWGEPGCHGEKMLPGCSGASKVPNFSPSGFHHGLVSLDRSTRAGLGHQVGFAGSASPSPQLPAFQQSIGAGDTMGNPPMLPLQLRQPCGCTHAGNTHRPGPITGNSGAAALPSTPSPRWRGDEAGAGDGMAGGTGARVPPGACRELPGGCRDRAEGWAGGHPAAAFVCHSDN